jgi:hypothetical protein
MPKQPIDKLFQKLGAPLLNIRWSWGSTTNDGKTVFLRVWSDETQKIGDEHFVQITDTTRFGTETSLGYSERLRHIEAIQSGAECFLIFCNPKKPVTIPRVLLDYVDDRIFPGGKIILKDGNEWIQFLGGVKIQEHLTRSTHSL